MIILANFYGILPLTCHEVVGKTVKKVIVKWTQSEI